MRDSGDWLDFDAPPHEMNVVFRVDASLAIGTGHVVRCLTLAEGLRDRGSTCAFVCREDEGNLCDLIEERGFAVSRLPAEEEAESFAGASAAPEVDWRRDSDQTARAIARSFAKPDWLVVDHYGVDRRWEEASRGAAGRLLVIDDLANRSHDCDLLLDQNLVEQMATRYAGLVPSGCELLLGPAYALLRPEYAKIRDTVRVRSGPVRRVLIFFGGADGLSMTERAVSAFLTLGRADVAADIVVGLNSAATEALTAQAGDHANLQLHSGLASLAPLIQEADLAIGAGGATTWERLCLGLPSLVVTLADNQRAGAECLNRLGLIRWIGHLDTVDDAAIAGALGELLATDLPPDWSRRCMEVVDGKGIARVVTSILAAADTPSRVRRVTAEDEELLLEWANDPVTRANALSPEAIPAATHRAWLRKRLESFDRCRFYIVETGDGVPVGQVRFERAGEDWEVHYAVAPNFRRRGLGSPLLQAAIRAWRADGSTGIVFGRVKSSNAPSRKIFEALGFYVEASPDQDVLRYVRAG